MAQGFTITPRESEHRMARPNFSFQKRQRELEKRKKKEQKLQRKLERKEAQPTDDTAPVDSDDQDGE